jgi:hypothetical protein
MRRRSVVLVAAAIAAVGVVGVAVSAGGLAPGGDRGLPTANLNNAAGANRSNVAWSNGNDYVSGDTFSVGTAGQTWVVTGMRPSNIGHMNKSFGDEFSNDTLYLGGNGGNPGSLAVAETGTVAPGSNIDTNANITHTAVTYVGGANYQSTGGSDRQIWQNDFTNLHQLVTGGAMNYFAVDGTTVDPNYYSFNHASNAALSGSPQQGANGQWIAWARSDLTTPNTCDSGAPSSGVCNGGWDKSSDINVQVFAARVATSKDLCKDAGWTTLAWTDGTTFNNQGDCIQYVNTGK